MTNLFKKELPIGISDYRELIEYKNPITKEGYLYVDKSLFIREIIADSGTKVIVLTRPRRFGKTLNLSMLQYFYASEVDKKPTAGLFDNLEITKYPDCMQQQGQYPVIFISFKDAKYKNFNLCYEHIKDKVSDIYSDYDHLLQSNNLKTKDRHYFEKMLAGTASITELDKSLLELTKIIYKTTGKQSVVLIDEYDTPIQEAFIHGYYDELISFMRNFFSSGLKDNTVIKRSILTGILRVSKESLFSGLSNVEIYSVLDEKYSHCFGFTEEETNNILFKANLLTDSSQTKEWYNGYNFGGTIIYNPLSIIKFIKEKGQLDPYWINTSGNELIKTLLIKPEAIAQEKLKQLVTGNSIKEIIDEHIVFKDIDKNKSAIWSLFIMSGYLKVSSIMKTEYGKMCELSIPNKEVEFLYKQTFIEWVAGKGGVNWYLEFIDDLANGRVIKFAEKLQIFISETLSCHDVGHKTQEAFYHGLMLAFVCGLKDSHIVKSNKESGLGFYDVAIIPKNVNNLGIVMEFKAIEKAKTTEEENKLEIEAKKALKQINKSNYIVELKQLNINKICKMGIAFSKKAVKIHHEVT